MRILTSSLAIASAGIMVVGLAGPADAGSRTLKDARLDANAANDIIKVKYTHTKKRVSAKVWVRNLRRNGEFVFAVGNPRNTKRFGVAATRNGNKLRKNFYTYKNKKISRKRCKGARVVWRAKRNTVWLSFPKRCYKPLGKRIGMLASSVPKRWPKPPTAIDEGPFTLLRR